MKRFIAFSGGVESTTMALLYGATATPIFADAGWEHAAMYERIRLVEATLREFHGPGFDVVRVTRNGETLQDYIRDSRFFPSPMARFCTRMFKIQPIDNFLRQFADEEGGVELMIGLNADERDRTGNHGLLPFVKYSYPLLDAGITRAKCLEYLGRVNLKPSFPAYMSRGGVSGASSSRKRSSPRWRTYRRKKRIPWPTWRTRYRTSGGSTTTSSRRSLICGRFSTKPRRPCSREPRCIP